MEIDKNSHLRYYFFYYALVPSWEPLHFIT